MKVGTLYQTSVESCDSCQLSSTTTLLTFKMQENAMKAALMPDILMLSMGVEKLIDISDKDCQEPANLDLFERNIPYCALWIYDFGVYDTSAVYRFDVSFPFTIGSPLPSDSWVWYRNYTLEVYPPPSFWQQQLQDPEKVRIYDYSLLFKDGPDKGKSIGRITKLGLKLVPGR